ncbi:hypothetical protein RF11_04054 [Thelohanellus kitauei]|uniref:Uncharacterized protein n=1 Tax=Thelohanellus kitauei TaxID=669202 RepID=A0A0C2JQ57_THEKT|nr:hypothetical protein RF11_04054 [Thelohanellus kitauei]
MAYDQIIQDFTLNAKRVTDSMEEERQWAIEWMNKFEESEQALNTCFQILQASIDDDVNLICVKILQNKICICLVNMIARTDIWNMLPLLVVHDILSIIPEDVASQHDSSDLFSKHIAVVFLRQLFTYFNKSENPELNDLKSNIKQDGEPFQQLFVDFLQAFQANSTRLPEIIESCGIMVRFFSETNNMEWKIVVMICDILLKADPEQTDLVYACLRFIKTYVRYFQPPNEEEYMRRYQYFSVLVQDLYPIIGAAIGRKNEKMCVINNLDWLQFLVLYQP